MGFLWRRRSSVVKIIILLSAVWFTIAFLIYSEDRRTSSIVASGPHSLELKYNNEFDDGDDNENSIDNINDNIDRFFNNKPILSKTIGKHNVNSEHAKNESAVNNVILSNLNNNDNFNSNKNANDDISNSNTYGKHKRLDAQQRYDAKKSGSDENGKCPTTFTCFQLF